MFGERRKHQRQTINRLAKFQTTSGGLPRECTITDISVSGARLFVGDAEVPDKFHLLISGDKIVREECQLVWRLGGEVGVTFVTEQRNKDRAEFVNRLRTQAQQVFQGVP
jgi:PilZ domain